MKGIGQSEMKILRFISERGHCSVKDASDFFEAEGIARTTILTVMERLREKGFLVRKKAAGVYRYSPKISQSEVLHKLIKDFVSKTLGGTISPFLAYLDGDAQLSSQELAELKNIIEKQETSKQGGDNV